MESSRDSSIWRSLAVAFGDGLAFGVGMTLTQKAGRRDVPFQTETGRPPERLAELEQRLALVEKAPARLDPKVLEAIVGAVEGRLGERDAQWAEKLAALRRESADLVTALRKDVVEDLRTLEDQSVSLQQEMAEAIPRAVEERVAANLDARTGEIEERLREEVRQSAAQAGTLAVEALDGAMEPKLAALRTLLEQRDREVVELRQCLDASDQRVRDLLQAIGETCRAAAERMGPPPSADAVEAAGATEEPAAPAEPEAPAAIPEPPLEEPPRFAVQPARLWRIPLVSSLLIAGGCLLSLYWL